MADEWAAFRQTPMAPEDDPWKAFRDKPQISTAEDVAKSAASGVVKGGIGIVSLPNTIGTLANDAGKWVARQLGREPSEVGSTAKLMPSYQGTKEAVESVTGKLHEPQTTAGEYAQTIGEFAPNAVFPGGMINRAVNVIAPAVASETAGQATKGTAAEPYARIAGGIIGSLVAPQTGMRAVSPFPMSPERAQQVAVLDAQGVGQHLTAGQRTGKETLRWMEAASQHTPFAGNRAAQMQEAAGEAFTGAALRNVGENAARATPPVIDRAFRRIGGEFDRLAQNNTMAVDPPFVNDLTAAVRQYHSLTPPSARAPIIETTIREIGDEVLANNGQMPGALYQAWRSRLDKAARGSRSDPQLQDALFGIRNAMDDVMERSISPQDAAAWRQARQHYRNLMVIEKAAAGAGENTAMGLISPSQLRNAVRQQNPRDYVRGNGDMADLSRAGEAIMKPLPQSGTTPRAAAMGLMGASGAAVGSLAGGAPGAAVGALAGPALQGLGARALMSRPVQAYLSNQVAAPAANAFQRAPIWGGVPESVIATEEQKKADEIKQQLLRVMLTKQSNL